MAQDRDTQPHWYVAHTYSGYENKVRQDLETIVENRRLQDLIQEVRVPTETVVDADGKEKESKLFPGYVLVKMIMTDETWYVVRNARGVTGFVGPSSKPIPLSEEEVEKLGVETPVRSAPLAYKGAKRLRNWNSHRSNRWIDLFSVSTARFGARLL